MSYGTTRDSEQLRMFDASIDRFTWRYNRSNGPANGPRRTVFLFPGGMGSALMRADTPYVDGMPTSQSFRYHQVWLTPGTFLGDVLDLKLKKVNGKHRDKGKRIIVADGSISFLGCTPYDGFAKLCKRKGIDYFVVGWDWRRRIDRIGSFFLKKFLPYFQEKVKNACNNADPLEAFSLVGHSAGGMVVNWILRKHDSAQYNLLRAITVCTPFYGYGGQIRRWFEGEPYFNYLGKKKIIKVLSSMPSCYSFQFLSGKTWQDNQVDLGQDPEPLYQLKEYPSRDKATQDDADPYNPTSNGDLRRYPSANASGFDMNELGKAKAIVELLADPLSQELGQKFVNIRGDTLANKTLGSIYWDWVPSTWVPGDASPITNDQKVRGDDTQPAWSARHVGLAKDFPGNVKAVKGSDVAHMFTLNSPTTLGTLAPFL